VLTGEGRFEEAQTQLEAARFGFEELLKKHLLAFADHAAEFYMGSGNDSRRALQLARASAANRPTRRAVKQAQTIAMHVDVAASRVPNGDCACSPGHQIQIRIRHS